MLEQHTGIWQGRWWYPLRWGLQKKEQMIAEPGQVRVNHLCHTIKTANPSANYKGGKNTLL